MSSRFLPAFIANATYIVADLLPLIAARQVAPDEIWDFCRQYRRRGIARFLQSADTDLLQQDLQRSGAALAAYLEWSQGHGRAASKALAFYDAVASGDAQAAGTIARLTARTHFPDLEYEDDFLCMRILMGRFFLESEPAELAALLKRYETLLAGVDDPRYTVCQSLVDRRPDEFGQAFEQLIASREEHYAVGIEAEEIIEEDWATEGNVFIEGVALARLARSVGFDLQKDYLFVPSPALRRGTISLATTSWMSP